MPGDYSRFSDQPRKRFSALYMQQGRVQLDADWNESVAILKRRIEREANDIFGAAAVPRATSPNGFQIALSGTAAAPNLTIAPGRIYVDGILAECFDGENASYLSQPYVPLPPPLAGMTGDVLVYLDVWEREVTAIEDDAIVDTALNGIDTGTRLQTVWQVKVAPPVGSAPVTCDVDFGALFPASGGRLSTHTIPPAEAPDPCSLPDAGGYQGVDNRLYRVEVHDAAKRLFKWSRDNGSVTSTVLALAHGATTTLTVNRVGRDDDLGFRPNDWVEITDDLRELDGRAGVMANVTLVDPAARTLVLDRSLSAAGFDPTGAHRLRVRRWDQRDGVDPTTGLLTASPTAWVPLENGIEVKLTTVAGGALHTSDAWVFEARAGTGLIQELVDEKPRSIVHHYCALGTVKGLGGTPTVGDCRVLWPPVGGEGDDCSCTVCVQAIDHNTGKFTIQQAIEQVKHTGGTVCLGVGTFELGETGVVIEGATALRFRGQGAATVLHFTGQGTALTLRNSYESDVSDIAITCDGSGSRIGITLDSVILVTVTRCNIAAVTDGDQKGLGIGIALAGTLGAVSIRDNVIGADVGSLAYNGQAAQSTDSVASFASVKSRAIGGFYALDVRNNYFDCSKEAIFWFGQLIFGGTTVANNWIVSSVSGIAIMGAATGFPLQIVDNEMHVGFAGINLVINDVVVQGNVVVGTPSPRETAPAGIQIASASTEDDSLGLVSATIEQNQISGFRGNAIAFGGDAQRLVVRGNTIEQVGGGIVMGDDATGEEVVIEGNDLRDVGSTDAFSPLPSSTIGIGTVRVGSLLVRGNTLSNVGSAVSDGTPILGIRVVQPSRCTVDDNVIQSIGSSTTSTSRTLGIEVFGTFNEARVRGNRVQPSPSNDTLAFTGISISAGQDEILDTSRTFRIVPLDDSRVVLATPSNFIIIATGQQDADVCDNSVDASPSSTPLLRVVVRGACLCRGNRVAVATPFRASNDPLTLPSGTWATSAILATAPTLIVSDNRVNTYRTEIHGIILSAPGDAGRTTILGNVSTTGISLNGSALAAPWAPLNIGS